MYESHRLYNAVRVNLASVSVGGFFFRVDDSNQMFTSPGFLFRPVFKCYFSDHSDLFFIDNLCFFLSDIFTETLMVSFSPAGNREAREICLILLYSLSLNLELF